jgi:hypothetical protein
MISRKDPDALPRLNQENVPYLNLGDGYLAGLAVRQNGCSLRRKADERLYGLAPGSLAPHDIRGMSMAVSALSLGFSSVRVA